MTVGLEALDHRVPQVRTAETENRAHRDYLVCLEVRVYQDQRVTRE